MRSKQKLRAECSGSSQCTGRPPGDPRIRTSAKVIESAFSLKNWRDSRPRSLSPLTGAIQQDASNPFHQRTAAISGFRSQRAVVHVMTRPCGGRICCTSAKTTHQTYQLPLLLAQEPQSVAHTVREYKTSESHRTAGRAVQSLPGKCKVLGFYICCYKSVPKKRGSTSIVRELSS